MSISFWRAAIGAALLFAAPAAAQNGASWFTGDASMTTLTFAGDNLAPPAAVDRTADDMGRLFKGLCVDSGGRPDGIMAAIGAASLPLEYRPTTLPATKKKPAAELRTWRGPGLVVAQTDGFSSVPQAQCNTTFYPAILPSRTALADGLSAALGSQPVNAAEAVKKGKPNKYYSPRWTIDDGSGPARTVSAVAMRGNRYMPGDRVLIAVRAGTAAAR